MSNEGPDSITPAGNAPKSLGFAARDLLRRATKAALASLGSAADQGSAGWPSNALVTIATTVDGSPILLLSTLAHHTRNILADARASLLIEATAAFANPQAGPRVTVMGEIRKSEDASDARRFLARHPAAKMYAGFGDFAFYRMEVARAHYIGGFARAHWIERDDVVLQGADWLAAAEDEILTHMNSDHAATVLLYAQQFAKARAKRAELIAVDPEGFDLRADRSLYRIAFPKPAKNLDQIRATFVDLAQQARARIT